MALVAEGVDHGPVEVIYVPDSIGMRGTSIRSEIGQAEIADFVVVADGTDQLRGIAIFQDIQIGAIGLTIGIGGIIMLDRDGFGTGQKLFSSAAGHFVQLLDNIRVGGAVVLGGPANKRADDIAL